MPSGPPICALRASGRRTSGRGCGGWPTPVQALYGPDSHNQMSGDYREAMGRILGWPTPRAEERNQHNSQDDYKALSGLVAGWPTPKTPTGGPESAERKQELGRTQSGGGDLQAAAQVAGWPTPVSNDDNKTPAAHLAMKQRMGERDGTGANRTAITSLSVMAKALGWPMPNAMDGGQTSRGGDRKDEALRTGQARAVAGATPGSPAPTAPRGVLNPQFPAWLMGYPEAWATCAPGHQAWVIVQAILCGMHDDTGAAPCAATETR